MTATPKIVSREEWLDARRALLAREKEHTRARDALSAARRALPWVRVDKRYVFHGAAGEETLADLFARRGQLVVSHFMFDPSWDAGCKSCSFWADGYDGIDVHLAYRDTSFVVVSRGPYEKLAAYQRRMGWRFKWVSSLASDFNYDFQVSFTPEAVAEKRTAYNYGSFDAPGCEMPGISAFARGPDGAVFHTYSCYGRGIDAMNVAYQYLDITAKGRDEGDDAMGWLRRHDEYAPAAPR
ncbi:MAG TPA: DUF899 domain-containing protein [Haliangiales bacterium]|nr:DUF899 domain-containing protein [Haliangiales bacterium]